MSVLNLKKLSNMTPDEIFIAQEKEETIKVIKMNQKEIYNQAIKNASKKAIKCAELYEISDFIVLQIKQSILKLLKK